MQSTSAIVNKSLRAQISPLLRQAGFQRVDARNGWFWQEDTVWIFQIRAVGNYFSQSTGWPPGSVCGWLGVYFTFIPRHPRVKLDKLGRPLPEECMGHMRSHLERGIDQTGSMKGIISAIERRRKDIWWVDPEGGNADEVAGDIAKALCEQGLPWFRKISNLETALSLVEQTHDCFSKYTLAAHLARRLGYDDTWHYYDTLAEKEAIRIGISTNRSDW
jgi:hypothetical protein